jgi:large subunit ribosomal protein L24
MANLKFKLKKGDKVVVLTGKDRGRRGEILKMLRDQNKAIVQGINVVKRHTKPSQAGPGGIVEKELPIQLSNLGIEDPKDGKPTRVGIKILEDGSKVRIAKRSGEMIDG